MTITFLTNFINHHQVPLADEFYAILGDDYKMITFEPLPDEFRKRGYADYSCKTYLVEAFKPEMQDYAHQLLLDSDVVIFGAAPESWLAERMELNKLTFRYEERMFKNIDRRFLKRSYLTKLYRQHTRYRNKNLYMLAASAYNALDCSLMYSYPNKIYKWGYFINPSSIDVTQIYEQKQTDCIQIIWCGVMAKFKRPDLAVRLAAKLKADGIHFHLNMIGSGGWEEKIRTFINKLGVSDCVSLLGNMPNEEVLTYMQKSHIFLFTSDRGEGWGVVLNEAMSNGCAVIASHMIGAAPFLVNHKQNGLLYRSGNLRSLYKNCKFLIEHPELQLEYAQNAYKTMTTVWCPKIAAKRFVELATSISTNGSIPSFDGEGPCSKAKLILEI